MCGRNNSKRREDFVHQAGQSATPKQLEVLVQGPSISSENFSCSINIAKFDLNRMTQRQEKSSKSPFCLEINWFRCALNQSKSFFLIHPIFLGRGSFIKGGKRGVGPPCAALERRQFHKVTLSNLLYLSGRDKVNMIFALVFPTKLSTFFSLSFGRLSPTL